MKPPKNRPSGRQVAKDYAAMGSIWFYDRLHGKSFRQMAEEYDVDPSTIKRHVRSVANQLADAGKQKIMDELLPLAIKVYKAKLQHELKEYEAGRAPSVTEADRLFKGMFILDHKPQEKDELTQKKLEEGEVETLDQLMLTRKRRLKKPEEQKQLPEAEGEVIDAE